MSANKIPTVPELDNRLKVKYQEKTVPSTVGSITTETTITALTMNGLTIGKTYRATFAGYIQANEADANAVARIKHNGGTIRQWVYRNDDFNAARIELGFQIDRIFQATATSVEFTIEGTVGIWSINGDAGIGRSFSRIEELPEYEQVSSFT